MGLAIFLFVAITLLSTCHAEFDFDVDNPIRMLRPPHYGRKPEKVNCQSFRLGVEAYNIRDWETIPSYCFSYIKSYFSGKQYNLDTEAVVIEAIKFARSTPIPRDLRTNVWIFDLDETLLSNLDYFNFTGGRNGTKALNPLNYTELYEWIASENSTAPALPAIKYLYDAVLAMNFKTIILSESPESLREKRIKDLKLAGYYNYDALILRGEADNDLTSKEFKTKRVRDLVLSEERYRVIATVGDQWSDLVIPHAGRRTFKVPNPVYYVA